MTGLSRRLQAVAHQVREARVVADIGCDHGFTAIYLAEQGLAERVIAMDINREPLMRAASHIRQHHMEEQIETRLSDGAAGLAPGEADTLLISGMGGALICRILGDSPDVTAQAGQLVLSPQSGSALVRHFLLEHRFSIDREVMLVDRGKYYTVIHAVHGKQRFAREEEYIYGKYLIDCRDMCLCSFLKKEQARLARILRGMDRAVLSGAGAAQRKELEQKLRQAEWALAAVSRDVG